MSTGTNLEQIVTSTPEDIRLAISYIENGQCVVEVLDCVAISAIEYDTNGTPTSILCYNPISGQNEIVATTSLT